MHQQPIKLVCFDWGGVILRICRSWAEGCAAAGLEIRAGTDLAEAKAARQPLSHDYQEGRLGCEAYFARVAQATGGVYTPEEIRRIHDAWLIAEYPGVDRVVERLLATPSVTTGLLSNTNAAHWERQHPETSGARPHFPTAGRLALRHASHLMRLAKPDARIYAAFEKATGFAPHQILFFDDLAENILAAQSRGWHAELIDHTGDTAAQMDAHLRSHGVW
jgi:FMN phosphatase YigB (HAD superfamily)